MAAGEAQWLGINFTCLTCHEQQEALIGENNALNDSLCLTMQTQTLQSRLPPRQSCECEVLDDGPMECGAGSSSKLR